MSLRRVAGLLAGPVLGIALCVFLVAWVGPRSILAHLERLTPVSAAAAAGLLAVGAIVTGLRQHLLFPDLPVAGFLRKAWLSWTFGMPVPAQVGEVASMTVLLTRAGVPTARAVALLLADKVLASAVLGALGVAGLARVVPIGGLAAGAGVVALGGLALLRGRAAAAWLEPLREALARPRLVLAHVSLTLLRTVLWSSAFWLTFRDLGASPTWPDVFLLTCAAGIAAQVPVSLAGLGTVEALAVALYAPLEVPAGAVIGTYATIRLETLLVAWAPIPLLLRGRQAPPGRKSDPR